MRKGNYIVVFLDVYGFKAILSEEAHTSSSGKIFSELTKKLTEGHNAIQTVFKEREGMEPLVYIFSDSIVLCYEVKRLRNKLKLLQTCIGDVRRVQEQFVSLRLPLRGGIAFGSVALDTNIIIGHPLVRAVRYENMIEAPVVLLPASEAKYGVARHQESMGGMRFQVLDVRDNQTISARLLLPRNLAVFKNLIEEKFVECMKSGNYKVATAWHRAKRYVEQSEHLLDKIEG